MENQIAISQINDFIFCPASIYFHGLYGSLNTLLYQDKSQLDGTEAHRAIDENRYSTRTDVLQAIDVYSEKYNLIGKIDIYDTRTKTLTERKNKIRQIYDGYIFQIYAQYFCLAEMGFAVEKLRLYSMSNNKSYDIPLPTENGDLLKKFEYTIQQMRIFQIENFIQTNPSKCGACIYESLCDRSLK
jgi:CRISPR-associated protein Cas4